MAASTGVYRRYWQPKRRRQFSPVTHITITGTASVKLLLSPSITLKQTNTTNVTGKYSLSANVVGSNFPQLVITAKIALSANITGSAAFSGTGTAEIDLSVAGILINLQSSSYATIVLSAIGIGATVVGTGIGSKIGATAVPTTAIPLPKIVLPVPTPPPPPPVIIPAVTSYHLQPQMVLGNLACPSAITWLPDGNMLIGERGGNLTWKPIARFPSPVTIPVPGVVTTDGDGGLMGIAIDPDYASNGYVYICQTTAYNGVYTASGNQVVRYTLTLNPPVLTAPQRLLSYDAGQYLNGGGLGFGPDGKLYVATGCAGRDFNAQSLLNRNGCILRINTDGSIPSDNPYGTAVWAFGMRNPLGMCWQGKRLWATDTNAVGCDEINLIVRGGDYGYPMVVGAAVATDAYKLTTIAPALTSGPDDTWGLCGLAYFAGSLYFGCLGNVGATAHGVPCVGSSAIMGDRLGVKTSQYVGSYGRIRVVAMGPDHHAYFCTSNSDGIGIGSPDAIYRFSPQ